MKYLAAYLLATLGGNASPYAKEVEKIISTIGGVVDGGRVNAVVAALNG